jgi:hypothetical protein
MPSPQPPNPGLPVPQAGDQFAWQPSSTAPVPGEEQLRQLAALTQAHWRARADLPPAGQAASVALQWQRSGLPLGLLHLEPGVVWWCAAGQNCLRAEVPPDALRALVGGLPGER